MSTDARVTKDLIRTLEDGRQGFTRAAERLAATDRPELSGRFAEFAAQRERFCSELRSMAATYGDDIDEGGTIVGSLHRGWMAVKDALSGSDASGVLDAAEQGEDHALEEYRRSLGDDISPGLRAVIVRQLAEVEAAHDTVRSLRDRNSA